MVRNHEAAKIIVARTAQDREAAYRLRYDVFCVEEGDYRYVDKARQVYIDDFDNLDSTLIICKSRQEGVVGTLRVNFRNRGEYFPDTLYSLDELAKMALIPFKDLLLHLAIVTRGAVAETWRRKGLMSAMLAEADSIIRRSGGWIVIGVAGIANSTSRRMMAKNGYRPYGRETTLNGWTGSPMFKDLRLS